MFADNARTASIAGILVVLISVLIVPQAVLGTDLDALVIPTLSKSIDDFWSRVPQDSGPSFSTAKEVFPGQYFALLVFVKGYAPDKSNNIDIRYDVQTLDPNGSLIKDDSISNIIVHQGPMQRPNALLFAEQYLKFFFGKDYPLGTYTIRVIINDKLNALTVTKEVKLELVPFSLGEPFTNPEKTSEWLMTYFEHPEPARALPAMRQSLKLDRSWLLENAYNLVLYKHMFSDNPFLLEELVREFGYLSQEDRMFLVLMAGITGSRELEPVLTTEELKDFYRFSKTIHLPDTSGTISTADHLDALWYEFLATGAYTPIRKIVSALALGKHKGTLEKIKAGELDIEDGKVKEKAYLEAAWQAALWSLSSNCTQIPQVRRYCQFIYEYEDLNDDVKIQLGAILKFVHQKIQKGEGRKR